MSAAGAQERRDRLRAEWPRKSVHIGVGLGAFALPWLPFEVALVGAGLAVLANLLWWMRARDGGIFRPGEGPIGGIVLYPVVVFAAILFLPYPRGAMTVWAVLAFGDAAATLAGLALGGPRWPHARAKTLVGTLAFVLCGGAAAGCALLAAGLSPPESFARGFAAAGFAGLVETLPLGIDDNILVGAAAALVFLMTEGWL